MLRWLKFWILQAFVTCKDNLFNMCLMRDLQAIICECFAYPNTFYASVCSERVTLIHSFVPTRKCFHAGFKKYMIISIACVSDADVLDDLGISFPHLKCKLYVCQIFFMSMLNGFIPLFKIRLLCLYNGLVHT